MGSYISYQRVKDYWAKDLPINRGRYNFDVIRYEYYRDKTVAREAFKAGEFDRFMENTAKAWETAYIGEAINKQHIKKEQIASNRPQGIYGLMFNTRKEIFKDKQIRQAITMAFDFEWINQRLFYNSYIRSASFFTNSDFAAVDLPDKGERDVLEPYRDRLPAAVFGPAVKPPKSDGKGDIRKIMKPFFTLFKDAGYQLKNGRMLDNKSKPFRFTVLLSSPSLSRVLMPFKKNLDRLGIQMDIQMVDPNQYVNRVRTFDYDMIFAKYPGSSSPGNELRYYFGSKAADTAGSRNYPGIKNPVVDELIEKIIEAPARSELVTRCRALDRVLRQEYYLIPGWHFPFIRIAYWNKFGRSTVPAPNGVDFYSWWIEPAKLETIRKGGTGYKN
ncbi:MAG: hypothetical protein CSA26_02470 [Desulfobacterales bacterium]|nr:MAG: hypothetical protein CSA26_02470 [Desulfobacterales bacterium]